MTREHDSILPELFEECCQLLAEGQSVAACVARHPEYATQLESLLHTVVELAHAPAVPVRTPAVAAQRRSEFVVYVREAPSHVTLRTLWVGLAAQLSAAARDLGRALRPVPVGLVAGLIVVLLVGTVGSSAVSASATAMPGDTLYPLKLATEEARLLLAPDPEARRVITEEIVERRVLEAETVLTLHRQVESMPLVGHIEEVDGDGWRVSGLRIYLTPATIVVGEPEVGSMIRGTVKAPGDGTLQALELRVEAAPPGLTVVPASPTPTATATATPRPTPTPTRVPTRPRLRTPTVRTPIATRVLVVPSPVPATPSPTAPVPTATRKVVPTPPRAQVKVRLIDYVRRIDGRRWTIGNRTVETDATTRLVGKPAVGHKVEAWVLVGSDRSYYALEIRSIAGPVTTPEPMQFTGTVESRSGDLWVIAGYAVIVQSTTVIEGDLAVGAMVQVYAERRSSGEIRASRIRVLTVPEVTFQGTIEALGADNWRVGGRTVYIDRQTRVTGTGRVGSIAQVVAAQLPAGRLVARAIFVVPDPTLPTPTSPPNSATRTPIASVTRNGTASLTATAAVATTRPPPTVTQVAGSTPIVSATPYGTAALTATPRPPTPTDAAAASVRVQTETADSVLPHQVLSGTISI